MKMEYPVASQRLAINCTIEPPKTKAELLERCQTLSGKTLDALACEAGLKSPSSLLHAKGWMGQLIEWYLGANNSNLPGPDLTHLSIEIKTIPINEKGEPRESTYVCTAPLHLNSREDNWFSSRVRDKLKSVLWVPILADADIPIKHRRVGTPLLWELPEDMEAILKKDWEELTEMLYLGKADKISARFGTYLHIRPKARNASVLQKIMNENGESVFITPKGFYLRTAFTKMILQTSYFL